MKIKYVIFDDIAPVLLSDCQQHADIRCQYRPTSAGFCSYVFNETTCELDVTCWGESISLGIKSKPDIDSHLIKRLLKGSAY